MISAQLCARIRRLFFAEHWRIGTIATELGVHHETVRNAVEADRFIRPGTQIRPTLLDPYKGFITKVLEEHPRLRATRIHQMLAARGYPGSTVQIRRYLRTVRPSRAEAYLRLDTMPGEQAQGRLGQLWQDPGRPRPSRAVVLRPRARLVARGLRRFALDQTLESFLRGHVDAFAALGGVPREILYDNLKSVVLDRSGDHIRFHPRVLDLAGHYHFAPKPCAPYRGNEKGKVERQIQYLRHSFSRRVALLRRGPELATRALDRRGRARPSSARPRRRAHGGRPPRRRA